MNSPKEHPQLKRPIEGPTSMSQTDLLSKGLAGEGGPKINPGESSYGSLKWDTHSGQYRIKTARSGMDNSLTMLNEATIKKLTRKTTVNTVNASPQYRRHEERLRSGSKNQADFESVASGLAQSIEKKLLSRKSKDLPKKWMEEKQQLKGEIKRLEFIVKQWELIDRQARGKPTEAKVETPVTAQNQQESQSSTNVLAEQASTDQQDIQKLRHDLHEVEKERDGLLKDMQELQHELKKIRWMPPSHTPRFHREEVHHYNNHSYTSQYNDGSSYMDTGSHNGAKKLQRHPPIGRPPRPTESEANRIHAHYIHVIAQKDLKIESLKANLESVQEELEQQRHDTVVLLERRTCELEKSINAINRTHEQANETLESTVTKLTSELNQERVKLSTCQSQLNLKAQLVQYLESQIVSLSQSTRRNQPKQQPQVSSIEAFKLVDNSFSKPKSSMVCFGTQTELSRCQNPQEGAQTNAQQNTSAFKYLQGEVENLQKKTVQLHEQLYLKEQALGKLEAQENSEAIKLLERNCNELVMENTRLKGLVLEGATTNEQAADETRIRIITKEITKCDLGSITNPLLLKEISELRLFRAAASKELQRLRNELMMSRASQDNSSERDPQKGQDRLLRNSYEMAISNLNSQLNGLRTKLQGLQLRYDIKCRQLKEKDVFIKGVIANKAGRNTPLSPRGNIKTLNVMLNQLAEMGSPRSRNPT